MHIKEISKLMNEWACGIEHPPWGLNTQEEGCAPMPAVSYNLQQKSLLWTTRRGAMADVILFCQYSLNIIGGLFKYI